MKELYLKTRAQWRKWLAANHEKSDGVWLVFYKKQSGEPTLEYDEAVEEALCFGWIDSIITRRDEESYTRKLTPRRSGSRWSELNKKRVNKLTRQRLMTEAGLAKVREAKESGLWDESGRPEISLELSGELEDALAKSKKARAFFDQLAPSYKKQFIGWVSVAKRPETRARRVDEAIRLLEQGKRLGMK
jgi:uncharacterized protein YdeI (YjbR/CyaY-like superfamily)